MEKRRVENVAVEREAEFEQDITFKFYNHDDIYEEFTNYNFPEFIDEFRDEFCCQVKCHLKYYLNISNGRRGLYFGRFLVGSLEIADYGEPSFLALPSFDDRGNTSREINHILQNEVYTNVKVCVAMEIKFILFSSLTALTEYEQEQLEDHYHDEEQESPQPIEAPFISDTCSICLTEKPNIIIFPCLHQSVCFKCENRGKLTKCPTCRETITRKIKI